MTKQIVASSCSRSVIPLLFPLTSVSTNRSLLDTADSLLTSPHASLTQRPSSPLTSSLAVIYDYSTRLQRSRQLADPRRLSLFWGQTRQGGLYTFRRVSGASSGAIPLQRTGRHFSEKRSVPRATNAAPGKPIFWRSLGHNRPTYPGRLLRQPAPANSA